LFGPLPSDFCPLLSDIRPLFSVLCPLSSVASRPNLLDKLRTVGVRSIKNVYKGYYGRCLR
jgi:hypothetical protein